MPEGHTVHRLAGQHTTLLAGGPVSVTSPQGRFHDAGLVDGADFMAAEAVGKHLFHRYGSGLIVHVHLGLYGAFSHQAVAEGDPVPRPVGQVRMRLVGSGAASEGQMHCVDLRGPARCEVIDHQQVRRILARLGPDPLDPSASVAPVIERIRRSSRPVAALLLDQSVISGVGNVYRAEVLFRLGLDPFRPGRQCTPEQIEAIWSELRTLMPMGVRSGGIVTVRGEHDHGDVPRRGADRPRNYVYQRDGWDCRVCSDYVRVTKVGARSMYWCPTCQAG